MKSVTKYEIIKFRKHEKICEAWGVIRDAVHSQLPYDADYPMIINNSEIMKEIYKIADYLNISR